MRIPIFVRRSREVRKPLGKRATFVLWLARVREQEGRAGQESKGDNRDRAVAAGRHSGKVPHIIGQLSACSVYSHKITLALQWPQPMPGISPGWMAAQAVASDDALENYCVSDFCLVASKHLSFPENRDAMPTLHPEAILSLSHFCRVSISTTEPSGRWQGTSSL